MARLWETAHFLYRDRMESLANPEEKKFRRAENSVCYRIFDVPAKLIYSDNTEVETKLRLTYQDIDFSWNWKTENTNITQKKVWKPFMVAGLYTIVENRVRFLAKITPVGAMNIDLGIRSYIDNDGILTIHMSTPAPTGKPETVTDETLPYSNVAEETQEQSVAEEHV